MIDGSYHLIDRLDNALAAARLANLGAGLAIAGLLTAIRRALDYSLADLPTQGRVPSGCHVPEVFARMWRSNMRAWKLVAGIK